MSLFPTSFKINETGLISSAGHLVDDVYLAQAILNHLRVDPRGHFETNLGDISHRVEVYDEPYIATSCWILSPQKGKIEIPYGLFFEFEFSQMTLDEWDRFHGITTSGIPFVLTETAQSEFFDQLDEYDDESITVKGQFYPTPPYWSPLESVQSPQYWTEIYQKEINPGWNLGQASPILTQKLPQLKLPKSKVIVLGSGEGHDAAYFAEMGHAVTAVDFSDEALNRAQKKYAHLRIQWIQSDVFHLPKEFLRSFDIVFEHTCFCAINPTLRKKLSEVWHQLLQPQGHFMGIFFTMEKKEGPPFGGSEWEIRSRLKNHFHHLIWERSLHSITPRLGKELLVYAQKK
ncbi:MAG TPA: methyltransferase domain-containing protein [Pseudobdellovibrionaceae bacterium]|nr:methyltransferase domain-containing protein [Pseudobdellovibrionaceae bacterium]